MNAEAIIGKLAELERRVLSLEGAVFKTRGLTLAVKEIIARWPGPFTAQQIRDILYETHPELKPMEEHHTIESKITRMAKQGFLVCTFQGAGPHPSIYEINPHPPTTAGKKGAKRCSRHSYESGFRSVVRAALEELPERWTLRDLKSWVAEHHPALVVPEGSWSSTLYKMTEAGELKVVKFGHRGATLKEYTRTEKRVAPSGDEIGELEAAWLEFRKGLKIEVPELLGPLDREELTHRHD